MDDSRQPVATTQQPTFATITGDLSPPEGGTRLFKMTLIRAVLVATVIALAVPATALAAKPVAQFHDRFTESFPDELCGIAVDVTIVVTDNFFVYADDSFKDTSSFKATFTNPETGGSVMINSAGLVQGMSIIDETAGTITFVTSFLGLPERIQLPHGRVLLRDAGFATFTTTFDLVTGELLEENIVLHGPHPDLESEFALLCELVVPVLT
jgi:hypothetical protein